MNIRVGCCGWAVGKQKYFKNFSTVELQSTFYKLPELKTVERWVKDAPDNFIFCLKAWQAITHPVTSPTWKRSGIKLDELGKKEYGLLRPTKDNFDAWDKTREVCDELSAKICVIQTPPSFGFSEENKENMQRFFNKIVRGKTLLAWEPRGSWLEYPEEIEKICKRLDFIHVVDPLRTEPLYFGSEKIAYFRLHGFGKPSIYNYRYSEEDLKKLLKNIKMLDTKEVFCMFNNKYMFDDAKRFKRMIEEKYEDSENP